jgi:hypothetical protein
MRNNNNKSIRRKSPFYKNKKRNIFIITLYIVVIVLLGLILFVLNKIFQVQLNISHKGNDTKNNENNENNETIKKELDKIFDIPQEFNNEIKNQINQYFKNDSVDKEKINELVNEYLNIKFTNNITYDFTFKIHAGFNSFFLKFNYKIHDGDYNIIENNLKLKIKYTDDIEKTVKKNINNIMKNYELIILNLFLYLQNKFIISQEKNKDNDNILNLDCLYDRLKQIEGANYDTKIAELNTLSQNNTIFDKIDLFTRALTNNSISFDNSSLYNKIKTVLDFKKIPKLFNSLINNKNPTKHGVTCEKLTEQDKGTIYYNVYHMLNYDKINTMLTNSLTTDNINKYLDKIKLTKICILVIFLLFLFTKIFLIYNNIIVVKLLYGIVGWLFLICLTVISVVFLLIPILLQKLIKSIDEDEDNEYGNLSDYLNFNLHFHTIIPVIASGLFLLIKLTPITK